jgi:Protein of unknown function (DUF2971)
MKNRLFKYLAPDRIDILENKMIRFTQPLDLNDPFEFSPFITKLMSDRNSNDFYSRFIEPPISEISNRKLDINDIPEEFRNQIPQELLEEIFKFTIEDALNLIPSLHPKQLAKNLFTSSPEDLSVDLSVKLKEGLNKHLGILSLTNTNENIKMWSHYAQNHEGFVIEFNPENSFFKTNLNKNIRLKNLRKVKYSDRPQFEFFDFQKTELEYFEYIADNVFYLKSKDWVYEKEFRLLNNLSKYNNKINISGREIFLFDLPTEAIKSVYLGVNSNEVFVKKIKSILQKDEYSHVKLYFGKQDKRDFKISFDA